MDAITRLKASIDQTRPIVEATTPSQLDGATNCSEWDVRALVNHTVGALTMFRDVGTQGSADPARIFGADLIGDDPAGAYDRTAKETLEAWADDAKRAGTANMPWGEMPAEMALQILADDIVVHGWDLARSTGQSVSWDQGLAAETLEFMRGPFSDPALRGTEFADPVPVPDDADAMTKLVAFLGRTP